MATRLSGSHREVPTAELMVAQFNRAADAAESPVRAAGLRAKARFVACCPWIARGYAKAKSTCIPVCCKTGILKAVGLAGQCGEKIAQCLRCIFPRCFKTEVTGLTGIGPEASSATPRRSRRPEAIDTAVRSLAESGEPASAGSALPLTIPAAGTPAFMDTPQIGEV